MKTTFQLMQIRMLIAGVICISVVICPLPKPAVSAGPPSAGLKSVTQLKTEAGLYQTAIREIGRVSTMSLSTPDDLKTANAIVAKHRQNLRYGNSKLLVLGLNDLTFTNSVKASIKDQTAAESFLKEVNNDPNAVLKLSGAQSLKTRITSSIDADKAVLRQVAAKMKQAASDIQAKYKQHHQRPTHAVGSMNNADVETSLSPPLQKLAADLATLAVVTGVAVLVCAMCTLLFAGYISGQVAIVGSMALLGRVVELISSEDSRNSLAECFENIEALRETCHRQAAAQPFPLNIAAAAVCEADYLLRAADCLVWG